MYVTYRTFLLNVRLFIPNCISKDTMRTDKQNTKCKLRLRRKTESIIAATSTEEKEQLTAATLII